MHIKFLKIFILALFISPCNMFCRNQKNVQQAFENSYKYEQKKMYIKAISSIQSIYELNSYEINMRLSWLYRCEKKYADSERYYNISCKIMPMAIEPLLGLAYIYNITKKWNKLESAYLRILKLDTKNYNANYQLGLLYYYDKKYIKAKRYLDVVLNLYPFDYNVLLTSAWNHFYLGNMIYAKVLFNKVLLYNPNDESALIGLKKIR